MEGSVSLLVGNRMNPPIVEIEHLSYAYPDRRRALTDVSLHYYYSADGSEGAEQITCNTMGVAGGSCSSVSLLLSDADTSVTSAQREARVVFEAGWVDAGTQTGALIFTISGNGPYTRTNDFSYMDLFSTPSVGSIPCEHIVLMNEAGVAIWGLTPGP